MNEQKVSAPKFQIGDRVKVLTNDNRIGTILDIMSSMAKSTLMYAVKTEDDSIALHQENQLEPAPVPISYKFEATIEENVAVVVMIATQGKKTWVCARGHGHILHGGEAGMAQAVSYASKRMFEALDKAQDSPIYWKQRGEST